MANEMTTAVGWRMNDDRGGMTPARLCGEQHLVAVGTDAVAERRQLGTVEQLQPPCRLLDLDPLAIDLEAVAPAAHAQRVRSAGDIGIEQGLYLARLLGAQSCGEQHGTASRPGDDPDVHLPPYVRPIAAEDQFDVADLAAAPPPQHPLQPPHLFAGDVVPEGAAEAGPCLGPAVLRGEAVVPLVGPDQVVLLVDRVAERLGAHALAATALGTPSSASRALRSESATQVKIGVSSSVYSLDSVGRSSCTRSRNIPGSSPSNATTNSWSSRPKE